MQREPSLLAIVGTACAAGFMIEAASAPGSAHRVALPLPMPRRRRPGVAQRPSQAACKRRPASSTDCAGSNGGGSRRLRRGSGCTSSPRSRRMSGRRLTSHRRLRMHSEVCLRPELQSMHSRCSMRHGVKKVHAIKCGCPKPHSSCAALLRLAWDGHDETQNGEAPSLHPPQTWSVFDVPSI